MIHQKSRSKNTIKNVSRFFIIFCFVFTVSIVNRQLKDCIAKLENDTLLIRNNEIERKWLWNNGELKAWSMKNVSTGQLLYFESSTPSFGMNNNPFKKNSEFKISSNGKIEFSFPVVNSFAL